MRVIVWWLIVANFSFNHLLNFKPHLPYNITLKFQEQNWFLLLFLICFLFAVLIYTYSINLILNLILNCDKLNSTRFLMQRSNRKPLHGSNGTLWSIAARVFCRTKIGLKNPFFFFVFVWIYPIFPVKIQDTKFRWYIWKNLLMEILNILSMNFTHLIIWISII